MCYVVCVCVCECLSVRACLMFLCVFEHVWRENGETTLVNGGGIDRLGREREMEWSEFDRIWSSRSSFE